MKKLMENHSIFIHKSLNGLADSLIKIFIPIIILKETQSLYLCLLFMIVRPIFFVLFNNLFKNFFKKHPTISIGIHIIPIILIQFIIFYTNLTLPLVLLLSVLMALFNAFYSVPINLLFMFSDKKLNVSKMEIGTNIGKIIFILIGGIIINSGTVTYLIILSIVASVLYILSIVPLFCGNNIIKEYNAKQITNNDIIDNKEKTLLNIVHLSFGSFQILIDEVLPVYLFFMGLTFTSIVLLQALLEIGKIFANIFANNLYKNNLSKTSVAVSCTLYSISSILILLTHNTTIIYILSALLGLSFPIVFVPIFKKFCQLISGKSYLMDAVTTRDSYVFAGRPFLISSYFIGFTFISPFIFASINAIVLAITSTKLLNK